MLKAKTSRTALLSFKDLDIPLQNEKKKKKISLKPTLRSCVSVQPGWGKKDFTDMVEAVSCEWMNALFWSEISLFFQTYINVNWLKFEKKFPFKKKKKKDSDIPVGPDRTVNHLYSLIRLLPVPAECISSTVTVSTVYAVSHIEAALENRGCCSL